MLVLEAFVADVSAGSWSLCAHLATYTLATFKTVLSMHAIIRRKKLWLGAAVSPANDHKQPGKLAEDT